ncbi:Hypothetical protein FKW44_020326 [Caligus rogercresseyi]|uniref:Uncharacterized protein n=1 Tax=Caligus rogercresseyi TaxID=217165 RepID=A0A7T8GXS0_CALRO|nr:Hypothetical protein FKW44_020326 [Caligus rogercresseyi]
MLGPGDESSHAARSWRQWAQTKATWIASVSEITMASVIQNLNQEMTMLNQ